MLASVLTLFLTLFLAQGVLAQDALILKHKVAVTLPTEVQGCMHIASTGLTNTCTMANNVTSGNSLLIGIVVDDVTSGTNVVSAVVHGADVCAATANTPLSATHPTNPTRLYLYTCFGVLTTGKTVVVTMNATIARAVSMFAEEYTLISAVDQTPAGNESTSSAVSSTTATTTTAVEVLFGVVDATNFLTVTGTFAVPSQCPSGTLCQQNGFWNSSLERAIVSSTGTYHVASSNSLTSWSVLWASFK